MTQTHAVFSDLHAFAGGFFDDPAPSCPVPPGLLAAAQAPCPQCGGRDITYRKDDYTSPRAGRPDLTRAADMTWRWTCETCLTWGVPGAEGAP